MKSLPVGIRSPTPYPNVPHASNIPSGERVATPLGHDDHGKNLVVYIVRTEEDSPAYKQRGHLANGNTPEKSVLKNDETEKITPKPDSQRAAPFESAKNETTTACYITPDDLLSHLEQSRLNHLRARHDAIRKDTTPVNDGAGNTLLTSYVYNTGPDGRRYAVGISTPHPTSSEPSNAQPDEVTLSPSGKAAQAYRQSSYDHAADFRSGLLDKAI